MSLIKQNSNFTQVPNTLLNNANISLKAKGVWAFINSKPNGWNFSVKGIQAQCREGREAISMALKELEKYGYLERKHKPKGDDGQFTGYNYYLYSYPITEAPFTQLSDNGKAVEHSNTILSNTITSNKDKEKAFFEINFKLLLDFLNKETGRQFRTINKSVQSKYRARLKDGYKKEDILNAIKNASKTQYHKDNGCQYLTPEFFSRASTLDKYGFATKKVEQPIEVKDAMKQGTFVNF